MKNLKYIFGCGLLSLLAVTSCTEGNDWDVDSSFDRLFSVTESKISVTAKATEATVSWTGYRETEYYLVQVSKDSLYDDVNESAVKIMPFEVRGGATKLELEDLDSNTQYFLRIRCCATGRPSSHWAYLTDKSFKTKSEQIMNAIEDADRDEDWIRVNWEAGSKATHLIVSSSETNAEGESIETYRDSIVLSSEAIAAGTYTVGGLKPMTSYTISIYNNTARRGYRTASTAAPSPSGDYKFTFDPAAGTMQEQLDAIAEKAAAEGKEAYSVTVIVPGGSVADFKANGSDGDASVKPANGMAVTFFGGAGEVPTLNFKKPINVSGSHKYIRFENLHLVNAGGGYFINQSDAGDVDELSVTDCTVTGFTSNTFLRIQGSGVTINTINLINSIFTDCAKAYAFLDLRNGMTKNIIVNGCTFHDICVTGKCFIQSTGKDYDKIELSNSTFYNICGNGQYFIDLAADHGATVYTFTNLLFGKSADEATNKNLRATNVPEVESCYSATDWFKVLKGVTATELSSADFFVDPVNGDFHFNNGVSADFKVGDPRWLKTEE